MEHRLDTLRAEIGSRNQIGAPKRTGISLWYNRRPILQLSIQISLLLSWHRRDENRRGSLPFQPRPQSEEASAIIAPATRPRFARSPPLSAARRNKLAASATFRHR